MLTIRWVQVRAEIIYNRCGTTKTKGKLSYIIRPILRSEYDKWTVIRMKTKIRECEEYRSVF